MLCDYCTHKNSCTKILSQKKACKDFLYINHIGLINAKVGDIFYTVIRFDGMSNPAIVAQYKITKADFNYITGAVCNPNGGVFEFKVNKASNNTLFASRKDAIIMCNEYNKISEWD